MSSSDANAAAGPAAAPRNAAGHATVVLAAGGSTRLGRPKQLLRRAGEPLVVRAVRLAAETAPDRLVVMLGGHRDAVAAALASAPGERCDVPEWRAGLAGSLAAAARALQGHTGPVLVVGVDQPALEATHLRALLVGGAKAAFGCAATLHGDRPGIPAVLSSALFAQVEALHGDRGFGALLAALPQGGLFRLEAPALQRDLDTPEDVRQAQADGLLDRDD
ncbi:NTP transferase domain-containing protein [Luteimonas sp. TWI1416]|uniref:nucleotidyltransferase family protein n=1 Tax=unclassified Luteimonas TaxID=2629088 RepID=UPI003207F72A